MLKVTRYLVLVVALCILSASLLGGVVGLVVGGFGGGAGSLTLTTVSACLLTVGAGLGLALARQAWSSIRGQPSARFLPGRVWPAGLLFLASAFLGGWILGLRPGLPLAFPPVHVLATGLPPLIVLAAVGRRVGGGARWREIVLQISSGAFLSTSLAFVLEFVLLLCLLVVGMLILALHPNGRELVQTLVDQVQNPSWTQNPTDLIHLARSPIILLAALAVMAGLIPVIEESVKTVGVGLLAYRRPSQAHAYLWGVAGGAGFALVEGMLNTATGLDMWLPVVLLRAGATVLHCTTGGLVGLAWHAVLAERRWKRGFGLFGASIGIHGLWNALTVAMTFLPLYVSGNKPAANAQLWGGLGSLGLVGALALLSLLTILGLARLTRAVQRSASQQATGGDLAVGSIDAEPGGPLGIREPIAVRPRGLGATIEGSDIDERSVTK